MSTVANIEIWTLKPFLHIKNDNILAFNLLNCKAKYRNRIKATFYQFTDFFRDMLNIFNSNKSIVLLQAEEQRSSITVCKSTYTFQPAFGTLKFHGCFFVISRCLSDKILYIKSHISPYRLPSYIPVII